MSILAFGGEMGFFIPSDGTVVEATATLGGGISGSYNSSFARCYTACPLTPAYAETVEVAETADFWLHFEVDQYFFSNSSTQGPIVEFLDGSDVPFVRLNSDSQASTTWQVEYWTGAAWTAAGTFTAPGDSLQTLDINVVGNSASGSASVYLSGTNRLTTAAIDLSAYGGVAKVRFYGRGSSIAGTRAISQVIMADEPTIGWRLATVPATGAGATTDFTGTYTEIDEVVYSDADFINSAVANQVEIFSHSSTVPSGYTVRAFGVTARAKRGASGPANLQLALRSSGTTYFSGSKALDVGYGAFCHVWETDPATAAAFATSAIASLQFGVKSIT